MAKRANGGPAEAALKREKDEAEGRATGGAVARKSGGKVPGMASAMRPDRRARGGATSENPLSAAGKMSTLPFERSGSKPNGGGKGMDRD